MADTPWSTINVYDSEVSLSSNTTGQASEIIDVKVPQGYRYEFPAEPKPHGIQLFMMTHEQTTAPTGTNTISLSNDLVNSPSRRDVGTSGGETATSGASSLVVWDDDSGVATQTEVDAVDYDADTYDYTNSTGTASTHEVFYLWGESSEIEFRHYQKDLQDFDHVGGGTAREFHLSSVFSDEEKVAFGRRFTVNEKEHLKVYLNSSVDLTNWDAVNSGDGPGSNVDTRSYSYFELPVRKTPV